jgi:uncharacterized protein with von Willebrand factor type A (vWA) domain
MRCQHKEKIEELRQSRAENKHGYAAHENLCRRASLEKTNAIEGSARERPEEREASHAGISRANGSEVNPRGQGLRAEADAAHGVHACESRDAGRAPPFRF